MRFDEFYFVAEGVAEKKASLRREIWQAIINANALEDLDVYFDNDIVEYNPKRKFPMNRLNPQLGKKTFLLYVADKNKMRMEMAKQFVKRLKGKGLKVQQEMFEGRRPIVKVCKNDVCLKFTFKNNLKNTVKSVDYEDAIVQVWNGKRAKKPEVQSAAENIVNFLRKKVKVKGFAIYSGSKKLGKDALSSFWVDGNEKPDSTPKPDFMLDRPFRISLKIGTGAQLCSSKIIGAEGNKLILSSLEGTKVNKSLQDEIRSMVSKRFERPKGFGTEKQLARSASDIEEYGIKYFKKKHDELTGLLNEAVNKDIQFKRNFIFEAMTGNKKFEVDEGKANYILSAPYDGSFINFTDVNKVNLDALVRQAHLYVSFKSSGKSKSSTVRINIPIEKQKNESVKFSLQYFEEKAEELGIDHKTLNEGLKDVGDWFKKVFNIIKEALKKGIEWVLSLFGIEGKVEKLNQTDLDFLHAI